MGAKAERLVGGEAGRLSRREPVRHWRRRGHTDKEAGSQRGRETQRHRGTKAEKQTVSEAQRQG